MADNKDKDHERRERERREREELEQEVRRGNGSVLPLTHEQIEKLKKRA
jgi:hypothetical protein